MKNKYLKHLFKFGRDNIKRSCEFHLEQHTIINEYCISCEVGGCYLCGNRHFDSNCEVEWGNDVIEKLKPIENQINLRFNLGYPFQINLLNLKCPCGKDFLESEKSTICSACGTATCSAECHKKYAENENNCYFNINFDDEKESKNITGLRLITAKSILEGIEEKLPPYSRNSISNSKYISSFTSQIAFTIILMRGFRQYGNPVETTISEMIELKNEEGERLYKQNNSRLCICQCSTCKYRSPHPIYNCYGQCENRVDIEENEKLKLGLYKKCRCSCSFCVLIQAHKKEQCLYNCSNYHYNKH